MISFFIILALSNSLAHSFANKQIETYRVEVWISV